MSASSRVLHHICPAFGRVSSEVAGLLHDPEGTRTHGLFELGSIYLNKRRLTQDQDVAAGDYLRIHSEPRRYPRPASLRERVLAKTSEFIVLDKPAGVPCHATVDNSAENLLSWWRQETGESVFITHRLDVPTSGCLVLARSPEASSRFNKLLLKNSIRKEYEALLEGHAREWPADGLLTHWMEDGNWAPRRVHAAPFDGALECRLRVLEHEGLRFLDRDVTRVKIALETGRTHQIRVQMSFFGHPVLNDVMYGAERLCEGEKIALRARRLEFRDPFSGDGIHVHAENDVQSAVLEAMLGQST